MFQQQVIGHIQVLKIHQLFNPYNNVRSHQHTRRYNLESLSLPLFPSCHSWERKISDPNILLSCRLTINAVKFVVAQDQSQQLGLAEDAKVWHFGQEVISQIEVLKFWKGLLGEKSSTEILAQSPVPNARQGTSPCHSLHPTKTT